jgi:GT2 family glycosyltransferase
MHVSVVIPTYNRGPRLAATLDAVLACDSKGLEEVEVLVVDDGSPTPAGPIVAARRTLAPFTLRCIRQENAGPAKARNTGFRASRGDIVLFMDDDILPPPHLLQQHLEAHQSRPGCVIFGSCPFVRPASATPVYRYVSESEDYSPAGTETHTFIRRTIVASGQLSVARAMFDSASGVYLDTLATPAAEELELSYRLQARGVPVLHAPWIVALHDHPVTLEGLCGMQYKHAVGYAEVAVKCPSTLRLPEVRRVLASNGPPAPGTGVHKRMKAVVKWLVAIRPCCRVLLWLTQAIERMFPSQPVLRLLYTTTISVYFWKGVRDGLRKFGSHT